MVLHISQWGIQDNFNHLLYMCHHMLFVDIILFSLILSFERLSVNIKIIERKLKAYLWKKHSWRRRRHPSKLLHTLLFTFEENIFKFEGKPTSAKAWPIPPLLAKTRITSNDSYPQIQSDSHPTYFEVFDESYGLLQDNYEKIKGKYHKYKPKIEISTITLFHYLWGRNQKHEDAL